MASIPSSSLPTLAHNHDLEEKAVDNQKERETEKVKGNDPARRQAHVQVPKDKAKADQNRNGLAQIVPRAHPTVLPLFAFAAEGKVTYVATAQILLTQNDRSPPTRLTLLST